ncbi:MAG: plasmid pRiA4b ORF-3 family protein [Verrucomicrobiota bacterium]
MIDVNLDSGAGRSLRNREFVLLRVEVEGVRPLLTRGLVVPRKANLGWIHAVIQVAMGWTNSHLHQFRLGDAVISDPSFELNEFEGDPPVQDERTVTVEQVLQTKRTVFIYEYDFGDSWIHYLTWEAVADGQAGVEGRAICMDGARACPPEDCGGVPGYEDLLAALRNRKHPEHRARKRWLGRPFDPEDFSIGDTNRSLARLPWPRVSIAALGKVLKAQMGSR